jgi:hypothetical protein
MPYLSSVIVSVTRDHLFGICLKNVGALYEENKNKTSFSKVRYSERSTSQAYLIALNIS